MELDGRRVMRRREAELVLAVFGAGAFLSGLELMITAVALPSILRDLSTITDLRHAAWIVTGYLLASIVAMPLAGRLTDVWGARRVFLAGLATFTVGSGLAGAAQTLDVLIAARVVQGVGGGILVPVATAAAAHLFDGHARGRALGVVGAVTFLGMAAGPFVGAAILTTVHPGAILAAHGLAGGPLDAVLDPPWRWVFYADVPIGVVALLVGWAATAGWDTPRRPRSVDLVGATTFSIGLGAGLGAVSLAGSAGTIGGLDPSVAAAGLGAVAVVAAVGAARRANSRADPFLDLRLFRDRTFASAALVSALTGYGFATAVVGGALFVDRVLYGGPDDQRIVLGGLALATSVGALTAGWILRITSPRLVTLVGLVISTVALGAMSAWDSHVALVAVAAGLIVFGIGFGTTVTARSSAAVATVQAEAYGAAASTVTVARMIGMAIGLSVLAAYGSTVIARLDDQVYRTPDSYRAVIPADLRDRSIRDGLVVNALEAWAAGEAASVMTGLFAVATVVTIAAVPAALALGGGRRDRAGDAIAGEFPGAGSDGGPTAVL